MRRIFVIAAIITGLYVCFMQTFASIIVTPDIVNFAANQSPIKDITVINKDPKNKAYVSVTPYIITNPGTKQEKKIRIYNPARLGLLITPGKLIIPPKEHRTVRFMLTKPAGKQDRVYRIDITPISGQLISCKTNRKDISIGIHLIVGFGVLAIVQPQHLHPNLVLHRKGKQLTISNNGNMNIIISGGKQSDKYHRDIVLPLYRRMYAGNVWKVLIKQNSPVTLREFYLDKLHLVTSN